MGKSNSGSDKSKKLVTFYLDECLPCLVAENLRQVGYPIVSWREEFQGQQGLKDPYLISYLGGKGYTWITKDHEAKQEHEPEIRVAQISVVWVSGLERLNNRASKNHITVKDLHRMLTEKLDVVQEHIEKSIKPQYFNLRMRSDGKPELRKITLEEFFKPLNDSSNCSG